MILEIGRRLKRGLDMRIPSKEVAVEIGTATGTIMAIGSCKDDKDSHNAEK
jgi:hypothetical protein